MRKLCTFFAIFATLIATSAGARADLLVSSYDNSAGLTVLRYDQNTFTPVPGTVATGDNGLGVAQGLAVAPDGSFYVSSNGSTVGVMHYSHSGTLLDTVSGTFFAPGTLEFGPNGNLYVGDLGAQAIYQVDTSNDQVMPSKTLSLGFTPGGFAFTNDASHDLMVSSLDAQSLIQYHSDNTSTTLLGPGSGLNVSAILPEAGGTYLLADFDLGFEPLGHHQIMRFDPSAASALQVTQLVNLTSPLGTGASAGYYPQPTSLLFDQNGNLLIGLAPDHNLNGAILRYDFGNQSLTTLVSNIGSPTGLAFITPVPEPASWMLAVIGGAVLAAVSRRRIGRGRRLRQRAS